MSNLYRWADVGRSLLPGLEKLPTFPIYAAVKGTGDLRLVVPELRFSVIHQHFLRDGENIF